MQRDQYFFTIPVHKGLFVLVLQASAERKNEGGQILREHMRISTESEEAEDEGKGEIEKESQCYDEDSGGTK